METPRSGYGDCALLTPVPCRRSAGTQPGFDLCPLWFEEIGQIQFFTRMLNTAFPGESRAFAGRQFIQDAVQIAEVERLEEVAIHHAGITKASARDMLLMDIFYSKHAIRVNKIIRLQCPDSSVQNFTCAKYTDKQSKNSVNCMRKRSISIFSGNLLLYTGGNRVFN